jgi:hypothetical protein
MTRLDGLVGSGRLVYVKRDYLTFYRSVKYLDCSTVAYRILTIPLFPHSTIPSFQHSNIPQFSSYLLNLYVMNMNLVINVFASVYLPIYILVI